VPLKVISKSKARLSPLLRPTERSELTVAMLQHVLSTLRRVRQIRTIVIVSTDKSARAIAQMFGADFVWEGKRRGLNRALRLAIGKSMLKGSSAILVVHADLPLLTTSEVNSLLARSRNYSVTIAPSRDGSGTNALFISPPSVLPPTFGKDSFRRHILLANRRRLTYRVIRSRGFGFDVDEPDDLRKLMHFQPTNAIGSFLRGVMANTTSRVHGAHEF
jgi:2-phospho-L-lactate guanylyltransferase